MDAIIVAVGHKEYRDMDIKELHQYYNEVYSKPLLVDVKSIFDKEEAEKSMIIGGYKNENIFIKI